MNIFSIADDLFSHMSSRNPIVRLMSDQKVFVADCRLHHLATIVTIIINDDHNTISSILFSFLVNLLEYSSLVLKLPGKSSDHKLKIFLCKN